jgi:glycine hydroxymethyltransferase
MPSDPDAARPWLTDAAARREADILAAVRPLDLDGLARHLDAMIARNREIHEVECLNLNPAANVMNPAAEAMLAAGLGSRPSLGHAGDKYETGLEAVEEIEVVAAALARRVFSARHAEVRVGSGALANAYALLATCRPGDAIIAPPESIGGHVTHHDEGVAGLLGLEVHRAPIDASRWSVDVDGLASLARRVRPRVITLGGSLNLVPHPVEEVAEIARDVGAALLFDAAHACGMIAGGVWPNPLAQGADVMTMSTYKSLGGPPSGLILTDRADLAERIDAIAYPGMTANFDVGATAALAVTLLDWLDCGPAYARAMADAAAGLAGALADAGLPVLATVTGHTTSHHLAVDARAWGGGQVAARRLRDAGLLASGIGMPGADDMAALRLGTPEAVRWGLTAADMPEVADLLVRGLHEDPVEVAPATAALRARFRRIHFVRGGPVAPHS